MNGMQSRLSAVKHLSYSGTAVGDAEKLVMTYRRTRDEALREQILRQFERLAYSIARRFTRAGEPLEDLLQEAKLGLIRAVELYDVTKGMRFATYAACRMTTSIEHYIRDRARPIRQPAWIQEQNHRVRRETERLRSVLGREPQAEEVAAQLQLSTEEVERMTALNQQIGLDSLDELIDEESGLTRGDCFSSPMSEEPAEDRLLIADAVHHLSQPEYQVVDMIYYQQMTQREVAQALGTSPSTVRRHLASALKRLRQEMIRVGYTAA